MAASFWGVKLEKKTKVSSSDNHLIWPPYTLMCIMPLNLENIQNFVVLEEGLSLKCSKLRKKQDLTVSDITATSHYSCVNLN